MERRDSIVDNGYKPRNAARVSAVLHGLIDRHTAEPFPAMSDHYRAPIEDVVVEPVQVIQPEVGVGYTEQVIHVSDRHHGWDSEGNYS